MAQLTAQSFIRHLPEHVTLRLARMLDPGDFWQDLAVMIPLDPEDLFQNERQDMKMRYSTGAISALIQSKRSRTRMLLEDWGIVNCQLRHLMKALLDAKLLEAAKYLSEDVLHMEPTPVPDTGKPQLPPVVDSGSDIAKMVQQRLEDDTLLHLLPINYDLLSSISGDFSRANVIGTGGFGDVFLGIFSNGLKVAVKRLKNNMEEDKKQFDTEIKTLGSLRHENLVTLLGYSSDGELQCLIYQYMLNGSLEDRLARLGNTPPLSVTLRVEIARGTAQGLAYLHDNGITHRDIKSANILLDEEFKPKIGDFATAKAAPIAMTTQILPATAIIGTQPYLAPEAYDFIVQPSLDIFSFGVVLLELITGLQALDPNREERNLKHYILEYCTPNEYGDENTDAGDIFDLRDMSVADGWNRNLVERLYALSQQCLITSKKQRIKIKALIQKLEKVDEMPTISDK